MKEQFLVNLEEIGLNNFIGDIQRNLNKIVKKDIVRQIQETIILEYDLRKISLINIQDSLYKASLSICNRLKTEEEKSDDAVMFKNNKTQTIHQMIVCRDENSRIHLLNEYEILVYAYKTENGMFFQTIAGSDIANRAITILGEEWDVCRTTTQTLNCLKKYKPVLIKPNFTIFNSEMMDIDDDLIIKRNRADKLLNDISIWNEYYDISVKNARNKNGDYTTVEDVMEERYNLICSQLDDISWKDILTEEL